ncbi:MAG: FAD-dependent oxidoreductase [uncultured Sulfurovum sp.]|uniref:FAD-dependent oxidoreductase n=1 Tax=uncultured Sulfurovum sp. TaxID=269237 RepID=A0A6S6TWP7_9BACT|nr:MAG: FAD-dependent oxidoreductase [uncultured Sulfurovum sp.]
MIDKNVKIAIIGGGVAGSSAALYFGKLGLDVTLIEKEESLISGPPFCHLHAGGNLYREISDEQCVTLLKQSIDFLRFYPYIVDYRPTVIVLPKSDKKTPLDLLPRLDLLTKEYEKLIHEDSHNEVLGESKEYYKSYSRDEIKQLKKKAYASTPMTSDDWMTAVAKNIGLDKVQFPLIMVQEYGLNLFRLAAGVALDLEHLKTVTLHTQSIVHNIQELPEDKGWILSYIKDEKSRKEKFDYIINAAGFRTGKIDDLLGAPCESMVEFKAAYVSHSNKYENIKFPEIIFHGERGTPQGMGQFTPYPNGYFQLHGMTNYITLYEDGLVANSALSCQPHLGQDFIDKIENDWTKDETQKRTDSAIKHLSQFIPDFSLADVGSRPLFGAQQIPGDDPTLRVAEVTFARKRYARCEIVKVSSVLDMIDAITSQFIDLGYLDENIRKKNLTKTDTIHEESTLRLKAESIAKRRGYPTSLANRTTVVQ